MEKYPRKQIFVLGDLIESTALDVLELLIGATFTKARDAKLAEANLGLERLRYFMRLSFELCLIDARKARIHARSRGITVLPGVPMLRSGAAVTSGCPDGSPLTVASVLALAAAGAVPAP